MAVRFEWDPQKAQENSRKHDVTFEEASECFADEHALDLEDPLHPERLILIGLSGSARLIFTVYAVRERGDVIKIISARKATRKEGAPMKKATSRSSRVAPGSARGSHRSGRAALRHPALRPRVRYVR